MLAALLGITLLAAPVETRLAVSLDSLLLAESQRGFSGAVLIARGDQIVLDRAYGIRPELRGRSGRVAFWLASDSKQFTAAAILKLEDMGRLSVTDTLGRFFPRVSADKRGITLHQLLTHTSGLPHMYRAEGIADRDSAVDAILALPLLAPPGTRYSYSNDGYTLLAAVVDIASRGSFDAFPRDSLFARAGLVDTGVWGAEDPNTAIAPVADPSKARAQRPSIYRDGHSVANWGFRGPTGVYSTTHDVYEWIRALQAGRVLSPVAMRALLGRHVRVRGDSTGESFAGYGWGVHVGDGRDLYYGHAGDEDWLGHSSVIRFTPEGEIVIVLSNAGEVGDTGRASLINRALRRLLDGKGATGG